MFSTLAEQFTTKSSDPNDSLPSFDNALYIQAVIEAIRKSAKDRAWTKVIIKKVPNELELKFEAD